MKNERRGATVMLLPPVVIPSALCPSLYRGAFHNFRIEGLTRNCYVGLSRLFRDSEACYYLVQTTLLCWLRWYNLTCSSGQLSCGPPSLAFIQAINIRFVMRL